MFFAIIWTTYQYKKGNKQIVWDILKATHEKDYSCGSYYATWAFTHESWGKDYNDDVDLGDVFEQLKEKLVTDLRWNKYHLQDGWSIHGRPRDSLLY